MVSNKIREIRKKAGLTQEQFGDRIMYTKSNISKWETGALSPDISVIQKICQEFNVDISEFFETNKEEQPKDDSRLLPEDGPVVEEIKMNLIKGEPNKENSFLILDVEPFPSRSEFVVYKTPINTVGNEASDTETSTNNANENNIKEKVVEVKKESISSVINNTSFTKFNSMKFYEYLWFKLSMSGVVFLIGVILMAIIFIANPKQFPAYFLSSIAFLIVGTTMAIIFTSRNAKTIGGKIHNSRVRISNELIEIKNLEDNNVESYTYKDIDQVTSKRYDFAKEPIIVSIQFKDQEVLKIYKTSLKFLDKINKLHLNNKNIERSKNEEK